ncbi:hypothetical protein Tco_1173603 [Tanacetum coccineum]
MSNKHKDWLVQEQTALGKDFSNPFMADNLPKIVWLSTHHIIEVSLGITGPYGHEIQDQGPPGYQSNRGPLMMMKHQTEDASGTGVALNTTTGMEKLQERIFNWKGGLVRIHFTVTDAEFKLLKRKKAKNILLMAIPKEHMKDFME